MVIFAVDGVFHHVTQSIVHPAHIPFEAEVQTFLAGYIGKRSRFFGDFSRSWNFLFQHGVGIAQESDGFKVFMAAVLVRNPLAVFARIVAVNHRGNRVNADTVKAETFYPIQGITLQEVFHFISAEVVNQGVPVLVVAFARVGVFVQRSTVEFGQAMIVGREMADYPVEDNADACIVRGFNQCAQFFRRTETAGRRIQTGCLIAP